MNLLFFIVNSIFFISSNAINIVLFEDYLKNLSDDITIFRRDISNKEIQNLNLKPNFYNNVIVKKSLEYNSMYYFESGHFEFETSQFHSFSKCIDEAVKQATNYGVIAVIGFKHHTTHKNTVKCNGIFLHAK